MPNAAVTSAAEQAGGVLPATWRLAHRRSSSRSRRAAFRGLWFGLIAALVGLAFWQTPAGVILEETNGLDWLFSVRGPVTAPDDVVVVSIDQRSAVTLGLGPRVEVWPRDVHIQLIDALVSAGAAAIAFDIIFERDRDAKTDAALAAAIADAGRVVLFERLDRVYEPWDRDTGGPPDRFEKDHRYPPLPALAAAATGLAPFPLPKVPARVSQVWMFKPAIGFTLPAVTLQVAAADAYPLWRELLVEAGVVDADSLPATLERVRTAEQLRDLMHALQAAVGGDPGLANRLRRDLADRGRTGPLSPAGASGPSARDHAMARALTTLYTGEPSRFVNYYGPPGTIRTIPIHALIDAEAGGPRERGLDLAGRTVFVGASELFDPEQRDSFYTVFTRRDGVDLSGVEIAATAYANTIEDRWIKEPGSGVAMTVLAGFGVLTGAVVVLYRPAVGVSACLAIAAAYAVGAHAAFATTQLWLPLMTPLLVQTPVALVAGLIGRYRLIRGKYGELVARTVPPIIAKQHDLESFEPGDSDREVPAVCLATDAANYAKFVENFGPAEGQRILGTLLDDMIDAVYGQKVDLCEISADGFMAAWSIVAPGAAARRLACLAAVDALYAADRFNRASAPEKQLPIRIGLSTGQTFIGNVGGSNLGPAYGIRGLAAVTASRLENGNKMLINTRILASADVVSGVPDVLTRPLGDFQLEGITQPVPVVEVLCRSADATDAQIDLCRRFEGAVAEFRARNFNRAEVRLQTILAHHPNDGPAEKLLEQCRRFQKSPPDPGEAPLISMPKYWPSHDEATPFHSTRLADGQTLRASPGA